MEGGEGLGYPRVSKKGNLPTDDAGVPRVVKVLPPALAATAACMRASTDAMMRGSELETAAWTAWSSIDWNEVAETAVEEIVGGRPEVRIVDVEPDPGVVVLVVPLDVTGAPDDAIQP